MADEQVEGDCETGLFEADDDGSEGNVGVSAIRRRTAGSGLIVGGLRSNR